MNKSFKKTLFWVPRLAGILFILFISLFALDVFEMQLGFWETAVALFTHLLPSIVLTIAILVGWKWEWIGAVVFMGWATFSMLMSHEFEWFVYLLLAGLPVVIGLFFLAGWIWRKQIREN